ncbi:hypothetical protein [Streptomyces sp. NPDC005244]|uniref:hypothetical protein n=1 Tax=Streptomyces sp. NPDC005244 TaxID=3364708 RepID=UPI0036C8E119
MDEAFVTRAAPLLKDGYSADSVTASILADDPELLVEARCNEDRSLHIGDRVLRFEAYEELRRTFTLFVQAYEGDRDVQRISHAYGATRIDFHNGVSILFRVDGRSAKAREIWQQFATSLTARGWHLAVGCGNVQIVIPGDGGPATDQYVEVVS